jgi:hypothetical protein
MIKILVEVKHYRDDKIKHQSLTALDTFGFHKNIVIISRWSTYKTLNVYSAAIGTSDGIL